MRCQSGQPGGFVAEFAGTRDRCGQVLDGDAPVTELEGRRKVGAAGEVHTGKDALGVPAGEVVGTGRTLRGGYISTHHSRGCAPWAAPEVSSSLALAVLEVDKDSLGLGQGGGNEIDAHLVEGAGETECPVPAPAAGGQRARGTGWRR